MLVCLFVWLCVCIVDDVGDVLCVGCGVVCDCVLYVVCCVLCIVLCVVMLCGCCCA